MEFPGEPRGKGARRGTVSRRSRKSRKPQNRNYERAGPGAPINSFTTTNTAAAPASMILLSLKNRNPASDRLAMVLRLVAIVSRRSMPIVNTAYRKNRSRPSPDQEKQRWHFFFHDRTHGLHLYEM